MGSVETEALPAGPGGLTRPCVQCGIYLISDGGGTAALLLRGPERHSGHDGVTVEVVSADGDRAQQAAAEADANETDSQAPIKVTDAHLRSRTAVRASLSGLRPTSSVAAVRHRLIRRGACIRAATGPSRIPLNGAG